MYERWNSNATGVASKQTYIKSVLVVFGGKRQ